MTRIPYKDLTPVVEEKSSSYRYNVTEEESETSIPLSKCCQRGQVFWSMLCVWIIIPSALLTFQMYQVTEFTVKDIIHATVIIVPSVVVIFITIGYRLAGYKYQRDREQKDQRSTNHKCNIKKMRQKLQKLCVGIIKSILGNRTQRTVVALPTFYPNQYFINSLTERRVGIIKSILGNRTQRTVLALPTFYPNQYWKAEEISGCHINDVSANNKSSARQQRSCCQYAILPETCLIPTMVTKETKMSSQTS